MVALLCGCSNHKTPNPTSSLPNLKPVFSILIKATDRLVLGDNERIFVPFELEVKGEISGKAMPYGVDIQKRNKDDSKYIVAKYALKLDDGESIYVENSGIIRKTDDGGRYFITTPKFETYSSKYKWLEKSIFIGYATFNENGTLLTFYEVR
ncbi:MAG: DUF3237 domain-containing protein [Campylobacter sp.]|nr:DUF3237 domain-containing protein [Campylobacter sp.]